MKIINMEKIGQMLSKNTARSSEKSSKAIQKSGTGRQDQVHLSKDAQQLLEMKKTTTDADEIRPEVVSRIQRQLKEGTYAPDNFKVAQKLVDQAIDESSGE